jgi:hypothetical protein
MVVVMGISWMVQVSFWHFYGNLALKRQKIEFGELEVCNTV